MQLIPTKLERPALRPEYVNRPRVNACFDEGLDGRGPLVSAPAGYGKSTVAQHWLAYQSAVPSTWISLDTNDSDLEQFVRYVVAAMQTVEPGCLARAESRLSTRTLPPAGFFAESLAAELGVLDGRAIPVLDDYGAIRGEGAPCAGPASANTSSTPADRSHVLRTMKHLGTLVIATLLLAAPGRVQAQQFNSDNYLAMPHGTGTFVLTTGTEYSGIISSFALFRRWEFFAGAYLSWEDPAGGATASWSSTLYAKFMPYENKAKNAGLGIAAGTGSYPGHFEEDRTTASFRSYWILPEGTLALLNGRVLWDLNPGVVLNTDYGEGGETEWGFLYSTRVAVYGIVPQSALVGEVYGTAGGAYAEPQYRVGVRWEPGSTFVGAVTWSHGFEGANSGGAEIGFMVFTPRFLCFGGCGSD